MDMITYWNHLGEAILIMSQHMLSIEIKNIFPDIPPYLEFKRSRFIPTMPELKCMKMKLTLKAPITTAADNIH